MFNKKVLPFLATLLFSLLLAPLYATADETVEQEASYKYTRYYIDNFYNEDGTEESTVTISIKILREEAVENTKDYSVSYSTSAETVKVLDAYTLKPDGKRIDAAENNFQLTVNSGYQDAAPAFSDRTTLTVIFPQVEMNDTVNLVYKKTVTDPLFPKHFSDTHFFSEYSIYDDARIRYSIPLTLNARYKAYGLTSTVEKQENGRQILEWTYKNEKIKDKEYPVEAEMLYSNYPMVMASTFPSYATISESYGARALPKAAVTAEIQTLADAITKDKKTQRGQVRALYDWVSENITYAGNCIGIGAVVPRDLDFVLKNKMGDCKDHATLLQAMLAAKNIKSTQALINAGQMYQLPEIPVASAVNHVINYIPDMDLYLDSTAGYPMDTIAELAGGKPVLLVENFKEGAKIPISSTIARKIITSQQVNIDQEGTASGKTSVLMTGMYGYTTYKYFKDMTAKDLEDTSKEMVRQQDYDGTTELVPGKWDEEKLTYTYDIKFSVKNFITPGRPGAFSPLDLFSPSVIPQVLPTPEQAKKGLVDYSFLCRPVLYEESYSYNFPENLSILAVPDNTSVVGDVLKYNTNYTLADKKLEISRDFAETLPNPICKPEIYDEYADLAQKIWPDLKAQVVYK